MRRFILSLAAFVTLVLAAASSARAAEPEAVLPQSLLPADACVYLRLDGWGQHQRAYDRSALAEVLRGDLGQFFSHLWGLVVKQQPATAETMVERAALDKVGKAILERGAFLTMQVGPQGEQTRWQATVVVPRDAADGRPGTVQRCLEQAMTCDSMKLKQIRADGLIYHCVDAENSSTCWWTQGGHLVVVLSTEPSQAVLERVKKGKGNITRHPLYDATQGVCLVAGFVDAKPLVKTMVSGDEAGLVKGILKDLGLLDVRGVTFQAGFEGKAWRETVRLHGGSERNGLLRIAGATRPVSLDNLPPLPSDATSIQIHALDLPKITDEAIKSYRRVSKRLSPDESAEHKGLFDTDLFRKVADTLGSQVVTFNSPAEGPWVLGWGMAIEVQDGERLKEILSSIDQGQELLQAFGAKGDFKLKKRTYHGVDVWTVNSSAEGNVFSPSFVLHDGWLVLGLYPQVAQGHVLRCQEKIPSRQLAPELFEAVAAASRNPAANIVSVGQSDQRDTLKFLLSLAPAVNGTVNAQLDSKFDASFIPNANAVTAPMFPSVNLVLDDGKTWTRERYGCLPVEPNTILLSMGGPSMAVSLFYHGFAFPIPFRIWTPETGTTVSSAKPRQVMPPATNESGIQPAGFPLTGKEVATIPAKGTTQADTIASAKPFKSAPDEILLKVYDISGCIDKNDAERSAGDLMAAIQLIEPESWRRTYNTGGACGIVFITHRQRFVVRQTPEVHQRIEKLLAELAR